MNKDELLNDLIDKFANRFRAELLEDFKNQNMPLETQEQYMPIATQFITLFSWSAAMIVLEELNELVNKLS